MDIQGLNFSKIAGKLGFKPGKVRLETIQEHSVHDFWRGVIWSLFAGFVLIVLLYLIFLWFIGRSVEKVSNEPAQNPLRFDLLSETIAELEARRAAFQKNFTEPPEAEDPSR